jgi:hypothetical protein
MAGKLRAVALFLALAGSPAMAQQVDANFQALLSALMQGSQVALLTPLPDGTLQVTSFMAPGQRSAADAALLIERARINLANLGVAQPTGEQLATALAGGMITVPTGSTQLPSVLPPGTVGISLQSQIVNTTGLPTVIGVSPAGVTGQAAAGASAPAPSGASTPQSPPPPAASQQPMITTPSPTPFLGPR